MSTVEEYKQAMNELAAATADFQPIATFLKGLSSSVQHTMTSFLQANFRLKLRTGADPARHRIDLDRWPSAETFKSSASRLAQAFNEAHRIYEALPQEDKAFLKQPPYQPELK